MLDQFHRNTSNVIFNPKVQGHILVVFMKGELGLPFCQPFDKLSLFTCGTSDGSISQAWTCPVTHTHTIGPINHSCTSSVTVVPWAWPDLSRGRNPDEQ